MTSEARQQEILRRVLARRSIRVKDLATEYGVHEMTIRRDLDLLADAGKIERVHGGARPLERSSEELSYTLRSGQNLDAKERIAREALKLIQDGDTIALDASTTSLALARALVGRNVQAIVTGLDTAEALAAGGVPFVLAGGVFHPPARSFVGAMVEQALERFNVDKTFFSAKAYTPEGGFADPHLPEVEVKTKLVRGGRTVIALLDHSKFGRHSLARIATTDEVDVVVSDQPTPYEDQFDRFDVRRIITA